MAEAELAAIAAWTSRGLTAYDASYVALAESRGLPLITDDDRILSLSPLEWLSRSQSICDAAVFGDIQKSMAIRRTPCP